MPKPSTALWASGTNNQAAEYVEINSNGKMMIKQQDNTVIWETQTDDYITQPPMQLVVVDECAFLRDNNMHSFWYIGTDCSAIFTLSNWTSLTGIFTYSKLRICGYHSNELFIIGGDETPTDTLSFNIESHNISTYSALPIAITGCYSCYTQINDIIYFIHNYTFATYNMSAKTLLYPASDLLLPVYGEKACITASEDHQYIFVVGGLLSDDQFFIYNINQNILSSGPVMSMMRWQLSCNVINDYLYAIGGKYYTNYSTYIDSIERLYIGNIADIASETWYILPSRMNAQKDNIESVVMNEDIYIMGGYGISNGVDKWPLNQVDRLDTDTLFVSQDNELPIETGGGTCSVVTQNTIYTIYTTGIVWSTKYIDYIPNTTDTAISLTQQPTEENNTTAMNIFTTLTATDPSNGTVDAKSTTRTNPTTDVTSDPAVDHKSTATDVTTDVTTHSTLDPVVDHKSTAISHSTMTMGSEGHTDLEVNVTYQTSISDTVEDHKAMAQKNDNFWIKVSLCIGVVVVFIAMCSGLIYTHQKSEKAKSKQKNMIEIVETHTQAQQIDSDINNEDQKVDVVTEPVDAVPDVKENSDSEELSDVHVPLEICTMGNTNESEELYDVHVPLETCTMGNTNEGNVSVGKPDVMQFLATYELMDMKEKILAAKVDLPYFEKINYKSGGFEDLLQYLGLNEMQEIRLRDAIDELQRKRAMMNEGKPSTNEELEGETNTQQ